ncbi:hypothetical protein F5Y18DRAFT_444473 [Xylariaceae sp. FL1019]|nr:hypothetical protein F5Y18DRAFT_444473 [Xylariaceae sp. FL1019]
MGCSTQDPLRNSGNMGPRQQYFIHKTLAPGLVYYRFHRYSGWDAHLPQGTGEYTIFQLMRDDAVYSVVVAMNAVTTVFGPERGTEKVANLAKQVKGPAVILNGGFFVHMRGIFRRDFDQPMLPDEYVGLTVGKTTSSQNFIPAPAGYSQEMRFRPMTDASGFTAGPSLKNQLLLGSPGWKTVNKLAGRFTYFARDEHGNRVPDGGEDHVVQKERKYWDARMRELQRDALMPGAPASIRDLFEREQARLIDMGRPPVSRPGQVTKWAQTSSHDDSIKSVWAVVPGNLSHAGEPNNRAGLVDHADGSWSSHAYTGHRDRSGLTLPQFRDLMYALMHFIGRDPNAVGEHSMFAIDGGQSVAQVFVDAKGNQCRLSQGVAFEDNYSFPIPDDAPSRPVPHVVVLGTRQQAFVLRKTLAL